MYADRPSQLSLIRRLKLSFWASQEVLVVKISPAKVGDAGDVGSMPGSGRSPGGGNGTPEKTGRLLVNKVTRSQTRLK